MRAQFYDDLATGRSLQSASSDAGYFPDVAINKCPEFSFVDEGGGSAPSGISLPLLDPHGVATRIPVLVRQMQARKIAEFRICYSSFSMTQFRAADRDGLGYFATLFKLTIKAFVGAKEVYSINLSSSDFDSAACYCVWGDARGGDGHLLSFWNKVLGIRGQGQVVQAILAGVNDPSALKMARSEIVKILSANDENERAFLQALVLRSAEPRLSVALDEVSGAKELLRVSFDVALPITSSGSTVLFDSFGENGLIDSARLLRVLNCANSDSACSVADRALIECAVGAGLRVAMYQEWRKYSDRIAGTIASASVREMDVEAAMIIRQLEGFKLSYALRHAGLTKSEVRQ